MMPPNKNPTHSLTLNEVDLTFQLVCCFLSCHCALSRRVQFCLFCTLPINNYRQQYGFLWDFFFFYFQAVQTQFCHPLNCTSCTPSTWPAQWSPLDLFQCVSVCWVPGSPKLDTVLQTWSHRCWMGGWITSLDWLARLLLNNPGCAWPPLLWRYTAISF